MKDCINCVNCSFVKGILCTCHRSYNKEEDGAMYHIQSGMSTSRSHARKCEHYTEEPYNRDEIFVL